MKQTGASTTIYAYDGSGNLAAEDDSASVASPCGTPTCYLTVDHLGSTRLVTDGSGNVKARYDYLPFGEEIQAGVGGRTTAMGYTSTPDAFNLKFTGQVRDPETLSDYFNARYYRPDQGRFNSPDPDSAGVDPTNTQTWNGYAYVMSNPMMFVDPSGLQSAGVSGESYPPSSGSESGSWNLQLGFSWSGGFSPGYALWNMLGGSGQGPTAIQRLASLNTFHLFSGYVQANAQTPPQLGSSSGGCGADGYRDVTPQERDKVLAVARSQIGARYFNGGGARSSPSAGFDCSGFLCFSINKAGIPYSYSTTTRMPSNPALRRMGSGEQVTPGDVILFSGHTGFNDPIQSLIKSLLSAQTKGGVGYGEPGWFGTPRGSFRIRVKCR